MALFDLFPALQTVLKVVSVAVPALAGLEDRPCRRAGQRQAEPGRPMSFLQAAAFQWVNPKAWAMALTGHRRLCARPQPRRRGAASPRSFWCSILFTGIALDRCSAAKLRRLLANPTPAHRVQLDDGRAALATLVPVLFA